MDTERDEAAERMGEIRYDMVRAIGVSGVREMFLAGFRFGRAYGLEEAATIVGENLGPKPPLETR